MNCIFCNIEISQSNNKRTGFWDCKICNVKYLYIFDSIQDNGIFYSYYLIVNHNYRIYHWLFSLIDNKSYIAASTGKILARFYYHVKNINPDNVKQKLITYLNFS